MKSKELNKIIDAFNRLNDSAVRKDGFYLLTISGEDYDMLKPFFSMFVESEYRIGKVVFTRSSNGYTVLIDGERTAGEQTVTMKVAESQMPSYIGDMYGAIHALIANYKSVKLEKLYEEDDDAERFLLS